MNNALKAATEQLIDMARAHAVADVLHAMKRPNPSPSDGVCGSCGALIVWGVTESNKRIPLDAEPERRAVFIGGERSAIVLTYRSHFATCPNAAEHRKDPRGDSGDAAELRILAKQTRVELEKLRPLLERLRNIVARTQNPESCSGPMPGKTEWTEARDIADALARAL